MCFNISYTDCISYFILVSKKFALFGRSIVCWFLNNKLYFIFSEWNAKLYNKEKQKKKILLDKLYSLRPHRKKVSQENRFCSTEHHTRYSWTDWTRSCCLYDMYIISNPGERQKVEWRSCIVGWWGHLAASSALQWCGEFDFEWCDDGLISVW